MDSDLRPSGWPYHRRTIEGAWLAIDELRVAVDELRAERQRHLWILTTSQRVIVVVSAVAVIVTAVKTWFGV